jgi:hypothetical protein
VKPQATGACEYDWAARVDRLTQRLDKLQFRVEALENSFADSDDPTTDELARLAPLQKARESVQIELRAAKEALAGPPSSGGASPKHAAAAAAPTAASGAKISAPPK